MSKQEVIARPVNKKLRGLLKYLFSRPCIVLIGAVEAESELGVWKNGKTNFALKLAEELREAGIIEVVATNIDTEGTFKKITDLRTLNYWLHSDKAEKLYIFDEGNIHLQARNAMTSKSVKIIQIFPEISKGHAKMIVIGQRLSRLDSELRETGWVRGKFYKMDLKTVYIRFRGQDLYFRNIPPTTIPYDPDTIAPFTLEPTEQIKVEDLDLTRLDRWTKGSSWRQLGFKHPQEANRELRKEARNALDLLFTYSQS